MNDVTLVPQAWLVTVAATVGACLGSFANVLIYRLPRNLSVVGPRSFCPSCRNTVAWYDNLPVLSWLLLRGRCRRCHASIPWRYPAVELLGAACVVAGGLRFGWEPAGIGAGLLLLLLGVIAVVDWEHMIIPHTLTVTGMVLGVGLALVDGRGLVGAVLGLAVGAGLVLALSYGYRLLRGQIGMGFGDVMLMGMVGAWLGAGGAAAVLFGGALLGTTYAVVRHGGALDGAAKLPFGTFLAGAAAVVLVAGDPLLGWYLGLMHGA